MRPGLAWLAVCVFLGLLWGLVIAAIVIIVN